MTTFVGSTLANAGPGSSFSVVPMPGGVLEDDLLLGLFSDNAANLTGASAGWSTLKQLSGALVVMTRIAGASEPGSYTFSFGGGGVARVGGIMAYRGPLTATPDASGDAIGSLVGASLTPTALDDFEIHIVESDDPTGLTAAPGFTVRAVAEYFGLTGVWVEDRLDYPSTSPTGTITPGGSSSGTPRNTHILFPTVIPYVQRNPAINHQNPAVV